MRFLFLVSFTLIMFVKFNLVACHCDLCILIAVDWSTV